MEIPTQDSRRWYDKKRFVLPALFLLPPAGIAILWTGNSFSKGVKVVLSVVFGLYFLLYFGGIFTEKSPKKEENNLATTQAGQVQFDADGNRIMTENQEQEQTTTTTNILDVKTENKEFVGTTKATFDMRLDREASEIELQAVAESLLEQHPNYERYFITYYLPSHKIGEGAWATSHIENGKVDVRILMLQDSEKKPKDEMTDLERARLIQENPKTKWAFNLIQGTKWDFNKIQRKLGKYEMIPVTSYNPNIIEAYYFPEARTTLFRNSLKNELAFIRFGRASE